MESTEASVPFSLKVELEPERAVVHCSGRLLGAACGELHRTANPLLLTNKLVVLDLSGLTHMDSMGLGTIVRLYVSSKTHGSCLELINLAPRIRQLLGITNLLSVLTNMCEQGINVRF
jgi:anti-sigma B factor antagonist